MVCAEDSNCLLRDGTFWSLTLYPATAEISFQTPEDPAPQVVPIKETWPDKVWAPATSVAMPDGLAVLRPACCSDLMSERSYGIALDIFL